MSWALGAFVAAIPFAETAMELISEIDAIWLGERGNK